MTIHAQNIHFSYGKVTALDDVSMHAAAGRVAALIGPNASGKSTLLRCMTGYLQPQQGTITLDSQSITEFSPRELASRIAYVAQRPTVAAAFTVREVVELGRYALPRNDQKIEHAMEMMEISDLRDRLFSNLSGGQQQRVSMARALAQLEPGGCLLLDEPTSSLDLAHVGRTARVLRRLAKNGAMVVVSLHDITLAAAIADDVCVLDEGRVIATGIASEILTPDLLRNVFDVDFARVEAAHGRELLVPLMPLAAEVAV